MRIFRAIAFVILAIIGTIAIEESATLFAKTSSDTTQARTFHTTTLLPNNTILVAGGQEHGPEPKSTMIYDIAANSWASGPDMHVARYNHTATVLNDGTVLAVGGDGFDLATSTSEIYDPTIKVWTVTSNTNIGRIYHIATKLNDGKVLVAGGYKYGDQINSAEVYDPLTEEWSLTGSMAEARFAHAAVLLPNGKVLVVGGQSIMDGSSYLSNKAELYDPSTGVWSLTGSMSQGRAEHTLTLLTSGEVVVMGGETNDGDHTLVEIYNPGTGQWRKAGNIDRQRRGSTATLAIDGRILVVGGGYSNEPTPGTAGLHDPESGKWQALEPPSRGFVVHTATMLTEDKVLLVGGLEQGNENYQLGELYDVRKSIDTEPPSAEFELNGGALTTTSQEVQLDISAHDSQTGVTNVQINEVCSDINMWEEPADIIAWQLSADDGPKTVCLLLRDLAGNVSRPLSQTITLDTRAGSEYAISINSGALFTNRVQVTTTIAAKAKTAEMQVSNDGGFGGIEWEPFVSSRAWEITQVGHNVLPRVVYVRFRAIDGTVSPVYQDDIVLDIDPPTGSVSIENTRTASASTDDASVTLVLNANDDISGVADMQISGSSDFLDAAWQPFTSSTDWELAGQRIYVRFRDNAGNISPDYSTVQWSGSLYLATVSSN